VAPVAARGAALPLPSNIHRRDVDVTQSSVGRRCVAAVAPRNHVIVESRATAAQALMDVATICRAGFVPRHGNPPRRHLTRCHDRPVVLAMSRSFGAEHVATPSLGR
jgi:hypothetical protein